jgi:very-short-patch-repair endonuclease
VNVEVDGPHHDCPSSEFFDNLRDQQVRKRWQIHRVGLDFTKEQASELIETVKQNNQLP